jgi:hypothetical protein
LKFYAKIIGGAVGGVGPVAATFEVGINRVQQMRGERREIRRALREDIDALENKLLVINLLASPLLVGAFGFWFYRSRKS